MSKTIDQLTEEELIISPFSMYIYAVKIIKGKLPDKLHKKMQVLESQNDSYATGYFKFLNKKNSIWNKIKTMCNLNILK